VALRVQDERLGRRVGAGVLVAAVLVAVFVIAVYPRLGRGGTPVRVHFHKASGLREGARVVVAGRTVGRISRVRLDDAGGLIVEAAIDPSWAARIPVNSEFFVSARSVLAPRWLEIGAPAGRAQPERPLRAGDDVVGVDPPDLDHLLQTIWDDLGEVKAFMDALRPAAARLRVSISRLTSDLPDLALPDLDPLIASASSVIDDISAGHIDPSLIDRVRDLIARVGTAVDLLRARLDAVLARAPHLDLPISDLVTTARDLLAQIHGAIADATTGTGSLAMLLADMELVDDVKELTKYLKRHPWTVVVH
jgi:ABC-type transporter Mla subunit MlaD